MSGAISKETMDFVTANVEKNERKRVASYTNYNLLGEAPAHNPIDFELLAKSSGIALNTLTGSNNNPVHVRKEYVVTYVVQKKPLTTPLQAHCAK